MNKREGRVARGCLHLALVLGVGILGTDWGSALAAEPGAWGPDPFGEPPVPVERASGAGHPVAGPPIELQGIIAGPSGMVAIIDTNIVRIGDRIGPERVAEITPHAVVLQNGSQTRRLVISVLATGGR